MADDDQHGCPACGRNDFATEKAVRTHYGIKHEGPFPDRAEVCEECGSEFDSRPNDVGRFCSTSCKNDWFCGKSNTNHPSYDRKTVRCEWCGNREKVSPSRAEDYQFCSRECQGEWQSATRTGEDASNWRGGVDQSESECVACGEKFTYKSKSSSGQYCSHDCYWEHHAGENHTAWKGGEVSYAGRWKRQRISALVRDQARCVSCSMTDKEHYEKYNRSIDIHHITPYRTFNDPEQANQLSNLATLCRECHHAWEQMAPLRPDTSATAD